MNGTEKQIKYATDLKVKYNENIDEYFTEYPVFAKNFKTILTLVKNATTIIEMTPPVPNSIYGISLRTTRMTLRNCFKRCGESEDILNEIKNLDISEE